MKKWMRSSSSNIGRSLLRASVILATASLGSIPSIIFFISSIEIHCLRFLESLPCREQVSCNDAQCLDYIENSRVAQFIVNKRSIALNFDEERPFQFSQVVGYKRLRKVQLLNDTANRLLLAAYIMEYAQPILIR